MSSRRRSMSPRNKRPAPRAYNDFSRGDRGDRYDRNDRNDRNEDYRRGREGYRERERYQDRNDRYSRYDDRPRTEQRLTDDFGRDIPRDSYREDKREVREVEERRTEKVEEKSEKLETKETVKKVDSTHVKEASDTNSKPENTPADSSEAPKSKSKKKKGKKSEPDPMALGDSDEEFQRMMGMSSASFGTTKHKKVAGNQVGGVSKPKATQYRQYMNRVGGFNRALSPERK